MGSCCDCFKKKDSEKDKNANQRQKKMVFQKNGSKKRFGSPLRQRKNALTVQKRSNDTEGKRSVYGVTINTVSEDEKEEKELIDKDVLQEELKHAVKGGQSAYGSVCPPRSASPRKQTTQHNARNASSESSDFKEVSDYLLRKGYLLECSIGSGNYAEVYRAKKTTKNRCVAVKVIDLIRAPDHYRINFLPHEIEILQHLKHPNIIKIYEITQTSNKIYMIMELAEYGNIADWIKDKGAFTEMTAWEMFKKIVDALSYMHSHRIAHRDLKIENILITGKLNPKLSDFSYAKLVEESNIWSQTYCGSIPYMPPEILQRQKYNPLVADIWSLGMCLYVMLNDALPYNIRDHRKMLRSQLSKDWTFHRRVDSKLSSEVKNCVRTMLEPDVGKRATVNTLSRDQWISGPKPQSSK